MLAAETLLQSLNRDVVSQCGKLDKKALERPDGDLHNVSLLLAHGSKEAAALKFGQESWGQWSLWNLDARGVDANPSCTLRANLP